MPDLTQPQEIEKPIRVRKYLKIIPIIFFGAFLVRWAPRLAIAGHEGGILGGHVYDITGAPAGNAEVTVLNTCSGVSMTARTQGDGTFQVPGLGAGSYEVSAMLPGFWRESTIVRTNGSIDQTVKYFLRPMPTHGYGDVFYKGYKPGTPFRLLSIRGTVSSEWGGPFANAKVQARNQDTGEVFKASTSKEGGYRLSEMPKGVYIVSAEASGFSTEHLSAYIEYGLDASVNFHLVRSLGSEGNKPALNCSAQ